MERFVEKSFSPTEYVKTHNLGQVTSQDEIRIVVKQVLKEYKKAVADYLKGEEKAYHYLLGQIMKLMKGKAEPELTNQILKKEIHSLKER